jgi:hypothetical protein
MASADGLRTQHVIPDRITPAAWPTGVRPGGGRVAMLIRRWSSQLGSLQMRGRHVSAPGPVAVQYRCVGMFVDRAVHSVLGKEREMNKQLVASGANDAQSSPGARPAARPTVLRLVLLSLALMLALGFAGCVARAPAVSPHQDPGSMPPQRMGTVSLVTDFHPAPDTPGSEVTFTVRYLNDTDQTFGIVEVWCRAVDAEGYVVGGHMWQISSVFLGPIEPGFKIRTELQIGADPKLVKDVTCKVRSAR